MQAFEQRNTMVAPNTNRDFLVRYGAVPEVARCRLEEGLLRPQRGESVVVLTHRGEQLGEVLGDVRSQSEHPAAFTILRPASNADLAAVRIAIEQASAEFSEWTSRVADWKIDLQVIDLERTLDGSKLILYVLNERGPECTRLAIQAAASGFGVIEVQPVGAEGLISQPASGGGCGSGGGGCGSGGCGH